MAQTNSLAGPYKVLSGRLSNAIYKGSSVQLRLVNDTILQMKYDDEDDEAWTDLVDLRLVNLYAELPDKPTINGKSIVGEINEEFITPYDALTNLEIEELLK